MAGKARSPEERRRLLEELQKEEEQYRKAIKLELKNLDVDERGRVVIYDPELAKVLGEGEHQILRPTALGFADTCPTNDKCCFPK
jgi:hypothetical protein